MHTKALWFLISPGRDDTSLTRDKKGGKMGREGTASPLHVSRVGELCFWGLAWERGACKGDMGSKGRRGLDSRRVNSIFLFRQGERVVGGGGGGGGG